MGGIEIKNVAHLARLALSEIEIQQSTEQLGLILNHFEKMSEISTEGIEPMVTPTEIENFWREDVVHQDLTPEEVLQNAPLSQGRLFKVPPVVG